MLHLSKDVIALTRVYAVWFITVFTSEYDLLAELTTPESGARLLHTPLFYHCLLSAFVRWFLAFSSGYVAAYLPRRLDAYYARVLTKAVPPFLLASALCRWVRVALVTVQFEFSFVLLLLRWCEWLL
jgi:hypothetical protein